LHVEDQGYHLPFRRMFNERLITCHMLHFTVLEEIITEKLEEGFYVRIIGKFFNADGTLRFDNFMQSFHSLAQLNFYMNLSQRVNKLVFFRRIAI